MRPKRRLTDPLLGGVAQILDFAIASSGSIASAIVFFAFGAGAFGIANAQAVQTTFAGKSISIIVGSAPGGAFDGYARLVARHLGEHLQGSPTFVVRNMPGAASMILAEHMFNQAPKDGTEIGAFLVTEPLSQLLDPKTYPIKSENLGWIGTVNSATNVLAVWRASGVSTIEEAKAKPLDIGSTTRMTVKDMFPRIANGILGTKFHVVNGYEGTAAIDLAMQRGEIQGDGANYWITYLQQNADWVRDGKIVPLFQVTFQRDPSLPNTPTLMELAQTQEQRDLVKIITTTASLGAPMVLAPGTPQPIMNALRRGFDDMVRDPAFIADAKQGLLDVSPTSGETLQSRVTEMMASPPDIVTKFRALVGAEAK